VQRELEVLDVHAQGIDVPEDLVAPLPAKTSMKFTPL
jgi:hypothetical protein